MAQPKTQRTFEGRWGSSADVGLFVPTTSTAHTFLAGPTSGSAQPATFRAIDGTDLPAATSSTRGGITLAGDLAGTADSPQVYQARALLSGSTRVPIGALVNGQWCKIVGGYLVSDAIDEASGSGFDIATGITWSYTSATTLTATPSGTDGLGRVTLYNGSDMRVFAVTGAKTAAITTSGAGGLDTGAEATSGYYVWWIGKTDGTISLLLSLSSTSPTMPSGYTYKRLAQAWFSNTDSGDLMAFDATGGRWSYRKSGAHVHAVGIQLLSQGRATTPTAIDLSAYVPSHAKTILGWRVFVNASSAARSVQIIDANSILRAEDRAQTGNPYSQVQYGPLRLPVTGALASSVLYYCTPSAPAGGEGLDFYVNGFEF